MNYGDLSVAVVNPRGKKRTKRTMAKTPPRGKDGKFKKGGGKKRRPARRKNEREENPRPRKKRRKRRAAGSYRAPPRTRRRKRNPRGERADLRGQGMWPIKSGVLDNVLPMIANKALVALAVKRWGSGKGGLMGPASSSDYVGRSWTFRDYGIAFGVTFLGAKLTAARLGRQWGEMFWLQGVADMGARLLWTEGFARSKKLTEWFGAYDDPASQMALLSQMDGGGAYGAELVPGYGSYQPGAIVETPSGRFLMDNNGQWQSMQGLIAANRQYDGSVVAARPRFDGLVPASRQYDGHLGHAMDGNQARARYQGTGSGDPYATGYQQSA